MKKVCKVCGIEKDVGEFREGHARCRECYNATRRERYTNDLEHRGKMLTAQRMRYAEVMKDPEVRKKVNAAHRERSRERYANDPEYREKKNARDRKRFANDPVLRGRKKDIRREWYSKVVKDPEYKEKRNAAQREWYSKVMKDPEYREKRRAAQRGYLTEVMKNPITLLKYNQRNVKSYFKRQGVQNPPEALIEVAALKRLIHQEIKSLTNKE